MKAAARKAWAWTASPAATRAISILMLVYLAAIGLLYREQAQIVECHANYAEAAATATSARTTAAADDRRVLDDLIGAVATATSRAQIQQALTTYRTTRAATDERRRLHPLPESPAQHC